MANTAQINPIFTKSADIVTGKTITTANVAKDGTGTVVTIFDTAKTVTLAHVAGLATATFTTPHNFLNGEEFMIYDADQAEYNGIHTATVTSPLKLTFTVDSGATTPATGTISAAPINGTLIEKVVFQPLGSNVATAARVFLNNGEDPTTAANNTYLKDVTLPGTTLDEAASLPQVEMGLGIVIPPFHRLTCTIGTTVAAGISVWVEAGNY